MSRHLDNLARLDRALFQVINGAHTDLLDNLIPLLSNRRALAILLVLLFGALAVWGGRSGRLVVLSGLVALGLADFTSTYFWKPLFHRPRPCEVLSGVHLLVGCSRSFSLFSNHAANAFALASLLSVHYPPWGFAAGAVAIGVGYSRVYVGAHYPFDVLAGALWGSLLGIGLAVAGRRFLGKRGRSACQTGDPAPG